MSDRLPDRFVDHSTISGMATGSLLAHVSGNLSAKAEQPQVQASSRRQMGYIKDRRPELYGEPATPVAPLTEEK